MPLYVIYIHIIKLQIHYQGDYMEVSEFVVFKFKADVSKVDQNRLMESLTDCAKKYEGFMNRDFYYAESDNRWVDHIIWANSDFAANAAENIMKDPKAGEVFQHIDESSIVMSHFKKMN